MTVHLMMVAEEMEMTKEGVVVEGLVQESQVGNQEGSLCQGVIQTRP